MRAARGRRALVTGATGFIGSRLARRLLREGWTVGALVRPGSRPGGLGAAWKRIRRFVGDIEDEASLADCARAFKPEVAFHLAKDRSGSTFEREAGASTRLAWALAGSPGFQRLVRTAHDARGLGGRHRDEELARGLGIPTVTLELFAVYGPGQGGRELPRRIVLERVRGAGVRLGAEIKDYVHVDDVVEAYLRAAQAGGVEGARIEVGSGRLRSEPEVLAAVERLLGGHPTRASGAPGREGHPADSTRALALLGWRPRVTFAAGLARMIAEAEGRPEPPPDDPRDRVHLDCWLGRARRWRSAGLRAHESAGEAALLAGDARGAVAALDRAVALDPEHPWAYARRAAAYLAAGRAADADRDAREVAALAPDSPAGPALLALLAAARGSRPEAEAELDRAAKIGDPAWLAGVRGVLRARWGESAAARADLDRASREDGAPLFLAERAELLNRQGFYWDALRELRRLAGALPGSPEPHARAAAVHLEQAQFEPALKRLGLALRAAPRVASLWAARARVRFVRGDFAGAWRELGKAARLGVDDPSLLNERARLGAILGKPVVGLPPAWRRFWGGFKLSRSGKFRRAARAFEAAAGDLAAQPEAARRASFYADAARELAELPRPTAPGCKSLAVVGLGYRQPFQVTAGALADLRASEAIYSNLSDARVVEFLALFPAPLRAIVFRRCDPQADRCARQVMPGFRRFKRVAVVTRGQPLFYGRLAYRLMRRCRARGIAIRVPPSLGIAESLPALAPGAPRGQGLEVRDSARLGWPDPRLGLVVYNLPTDAGERLKRLAPLARVRGACFLLAGSGDREFEPSRVEPAGLGSALAAADPAVTVYFPPKGSSSGRPESFPRRRVPRKIDTPRSSAATRSPLRSRRASEDANAEAGLPRPR